MPFQSGAAWTGNRRGRPRSGRSLADYVRKKGGFDGRKYIDQLHAIATGQHDNVKARLDAIGMLLERGWCKPVQGVELTGEEGGPIQVVFGGRFKPAA